MNKFMSAKILNETGNDNIETRKTAISISYTYQSQLAIVANYEKYIQTLLNSV